jgi:addiction module HigA family antidote
MDSLRAKNRKPTHPGAILREDVLPELGITQQQFADALGISRRSVSEILNEHRAISTDMAIRIGRYLGTSPESWLKMQAAIDLWELEQNNAAIYQSIRPVQKAA